MDNQEIKISYKNSRIEFDTRNEEWVAYFDTNSNYKTEFKRHKSLQKLKDAIERFNKKEFTPIQILVFGGSDNHGEMKYAEIISFTSIIGECWIKKSDGQREKVKTISDKYIMSTKLYACENIFNEEVLLKISYKKEEIVKIEKDLAQAKKERIHLIDSLQVFDISGYTTEQDYEE